MKISIGYGLNNKDFSKIDIGIFMSKEKQMKYLSKLIETTIHKYLNETYKSVDDKVGKYFWFEYHCLESPNSCDAELWYRSHSKIKILGISYMGNGDTAKERGEIGEPRVYRALFEDGFEYDVWEDEVMDSPDDFYRPTPPKK